MGDRLRGAALAVRGFLAWTWPFMLAFAVTANLVVLPVLVIRQSEVLREAKASTLVNRRLIERGLPCLKGGDPVGEACASEARRVKDLADNLALVQAQHDEQARNLDDAVARIVELQERQHGVTVVEGPTVPRPTRTPVTTVAPRPTVAPTTTTTVCKPPDCKPNKP